MSQALSVSLERKGTVIDVNYDTTALQNIHVDLNEVAEDDRSGSAKKLLGASVLYCYTAALDKALDVRGAKYDAIKGRATVTAGTDDKGRGRILGITLDVTVVMGSSYETIFDHVAKVMRKGCLISASLEAAFPVTYNLELECPDD